MKKIMSILILGIFLISLISATEISLGTFEKGKCINLIQICENCTYNNISTVLFPNSSVAISSVMMTRDDTYYNYTFCNTSTTGEYIVNGFGDLNGVKAIWNYNFGVTPTGTILKTSDSLTYILLTIGSLILFLLSLWGGMVLPFKNKRNDEGKVEAVQKLKYFKLLCLATAYILFVWLLNLFLTLSTNFSILTQYTKFFEVIFSVVNSVSYPLFVVMFIIMLFLAWKDLALKKLLLRGINPD